MLSELLPPRELAKLRRVAVTYSGNACSENDEWEKIGAELVNFVGLETLFVAMCDWYSDRKIRRDVMRGRPPVGYAGWSIGLEVREALAEMGLLDGRWVGDGWVGDEPRLRVVECDLRLDEPNPILWSRFFLFLLALCRNTTIYCISRALSRNV